MTILTSSLIHSGGLSFSDLVRDAGEHWGAPDDVLFASRRFRAKLFSEGSFTKVFFDGDLKLEVGLSFYKPTYFSIEPYRTSTPKNLVVDDARLFEKTRDNLISELGLNFFDDDVCIYRMMKFYFFPKGRLYSICQEFH